MKKFAFAHARHIYSLESYFTGGQCHLAWPVLTLTDENCRRCGEVSRMKLLSDVLKTFSTTTETKAGRLQNFKMTSKFC